MNKLSFVTSAICLVSVGMVAPAPVARAQLSVERAATGDAPRNPGPLATDISAALNPKDINAVMQKVGDWQLRIAESKFDSQWTYATLYDGLIAASVATGNPAYRDAVKSYSEKKQWRLLDDRFPHADDIALGQAYLDLYLEQRRDKRNPQWVADTRRILDELIARPDDQKNDLWWWCDALFMAPPVLARMYVITGDRKYLNFMDHEWEITTSHLYNAKYHLYFRDSRYFTQTEANGKPLFWSRGNGWVAGALVKILEVLPANDPLRPKYEVVLRDMCTELASIQGSDGLWRSGLLDAQSYDEPEISGSAFFVYAMAYGVRAHVLDRATFYPLIRKGWAGILRHVYEDGRLGSIQPIDAAPGKFAPSASSVYGVGGFLLAGHQLNLLAAGTARSAR
jgi:unsaturated rhamnogalacturonyl hydrolase